MGEGRPSTYTCSCQRRRSEQELEKKYDGKTPKCPEIGCITADISAIEEACNSDGHCNGFSYWPANKHGCLLKNCHDPEEREEWTTGYVKYFAKRGFTLSDERTEKAKEKKAKEKHKRDTKSKENAAKRASVNAEKADKANHKAGTELAVKERSTKEVAAKNGRTNERQEKWSRGYWDADAGFGTCTAAPCEYYADEHCHAGGAAVETIANCSYAGSVFIEGCQHKCSRKSTPPDQWIGPPITKNATAHSDWDGESDWKKDDFATLKKLVETESLLKHARATHATHGVASSTASTALLQESKESKESKEFSQFVAVQSTAGVESSPVESDVAEFSPPEACTPHRVCCANTCRKIYGTYSLNSPDARRFTTSACINGCEIADLQSPETDARAGLWELKLPGHEEEEEEKTQDKDQCNTILDDRRERQLCTYGMDYHRFCENIWNNHTILGQTEGCAPVLAND